MSVFFKNNKSPISVSIGSIDASVFWGKSSVESFKLKQLSHFFLILINKTVTDIIIA